MKTKRRLDAMSVLQRFDIFGQTLPTFNIDGKEKVNTIIGGFFTVIIFTIVLLYGITKFIHLESKNNPNVGSFTKEAAFD